MGAEAGPGRRSTSPTLEDLERIYRAMTDGPDAGRLTEPARRMSAVADGTDSPSVRNIGLDPQPVVKPVVNVVAPSHVARSEAYESSHDPVVRRRRGCGPIG